MMSPFLLFSKFMLSSILEGIELSSVKIFIALLISHSNRSYFTTAPGKLPDLIFLYSKMTLRLNHVSEISSYSLIYQTKKIIQNSSLQMSLF